MLNRQFSFFEGNAEWLGRKCTMFLETDKDDGETANKAHAILKALYANCKQWDEKFCKYAAESLTDLANDWQENDNEHDLITKEVFATRLEISEISIDPSGNIEVFYNDDDMFFGHVIIVHANINGEFGGAEIAG